MVSLHGSLKFLEQNTIRRYQPWSKRQSLHVYLSPVLDEFSRPVFEGERVPSGEWGLYGKNHTCFPRSTRISKFYRDDWIRDSSCKVSTAVRERKVTYFLPIHVKIWSSLWDTVSMKQPGSLVLTLNRPFKSDSRIIFDNFFGFHSWSYFQSPVKSYNNISEDTGSSEQENPISYRKGSLCNV